MFECCTQSSPQMNNGLFCFVWKEREQKGHTESEKKKANIIRKREGSNNARHEILSASVEEGKRKKQEEKIRNKECLF